MASPFEFSRRPAFIQTSTHILPVSKLSKAPQHNPYDKFTQPEFDAWIGGITGALKRALGQEDEVESYPEAGHDQPDQSQSSDEEEVERLVELDGQSSDEDVDDSFLYSTARRANKGKARDPREGPGFSKGGQYEPIVIDSEEEEEEEKGMGDEDGSDEWDQASQSEEEEDGHHSASVEAESSVQARIRHLKQVDVELVEEGEEEGEFEDEFEEEFERDGESAEEDEGEDDVQYLKQASSPVLVVSSDEEEVEAKPSLVEQIRALDGGESAEEFSDEEDVAPVFITSNRIGPPRHRPKREIHVSPVPDNVEVEEFDKLEEQQYHEDVQPLDVDTSFPPHESDTEDHVEIPDPWSGPRTYAEDYYSAGDMVGASQNMTADRLGEKDDVPEQLSRLNNDEDLQEQHPEEQRLAEQRLEKPGVIDVDVDEIDDVQPLTEDTSFPPRIALDEQFTFDHPVEILDHWAGPKTYAEDYYSGGDLRPTQNGLDPHRLGDNDESMPPTSAPSPKADRGAIIVVDDNEEQQFSNSEGAESPQLDFAAELSELWDGPINYDEDYVLEVHAPSPERIVNRAGSGFDGTTAILIDSDSEDEAHPVKVPEDSKTTREFVEQAQAPPDRDLTYEQLLSSSGPGDSLPPPAPTQTDGLDFLYEDITIIEDVERVLDQNQTDPSIIDWMYDATFNGMASPVTDQPTLGVSAHDNDTLQTANRNAVESVKLSDEDINTPGFEPQPSSSEIAPEEGVASVEAVGAVTLAEDPVTSASDVSQIQFEAPLAALCPTGSTQATHSIDHHDAPDPLSTTQDMAATEDPTPEIHDLDIVIEYVPATPVIEEIEEIGSKVDAGACVGPGPDLDADAIPEVHNNESTQETVVELIEVLDEDSATLVQIGIKEVDLEVNDIVADVELDKNQLGRPVSPILKDGAELDIATPADEAEHAHGDCVTPAQELDSQIARATSQEAPLQNNVDLGTQDRSPTIISMPPELDLAHEDTNSFTNPDNPGLTSAPVSDSTGSPPVVQASQIEPHSEQDPPSSPLAVIALTAGHSKNDTPSPVDTQLPSRFPQHPPSVTVFKSIPHSPNLDVAPYPREVVMRKSTDPVLLIDPYPASLSTPEYGFGNKGDLSTSYEASDEEPSPGNSPSSSSPSSLDKEREDTGTLITNDQNPNVSAVLKHPSAQVVPQPSLENRALNESTEADPDGDADPDFDTARPLSISLPSGPAPEAYIMARESSNAVASSGPAATENGDLLQSMEPHPLSSPVIERVNGVSATRVRSPPLEDDLPSILIIRKVPADEQTPAKSKPGRPQKRKRNSSIPRASSGTFKKVDDKDKAPSRKSQGSDKKANRKAPIPNKGKGKEAGVPPTSQGSFDTRSISSRSSSDASAARRMLNPSSRGSSRASSIASNAPSDNSLNGMQPSPTLGKGSSFRQQPLPPPPPPSLLHRHHHNRPGTAQPLRPPVAQKSFTSIRQADASTDSPAPKQSTSINRHHSYSSSPVTRSNCRYHKISIPLDDDSDDEGSDGDEDVKLVYFLVPGCSLGNMELNRDEKIVDHGDALPSDGLLMTPDLDAYAFNAPLLSVLRLLVGVDMLREGEIFYLPQPGSDWVPRKSRDTGPRAHHGPGESGPAYTSPRRNSSMSTLSISAPIPLASVTGPAPNSAPVGSFKPASKVSQTSSELTEVEDSPHSKRLKTSPVEEKSIANDFGAPGSGDRSKKFKYPEHKPDSHGEASDGSKHGLKRSRTSEAILESDVDPQKLKRQRTGPDPQTT
ncbi:hypothetical protein DXG01_004956 [Tephrocybe rancida]|nr:hypothetical protein DXG01_004956 [Tephrocybe rancida]